MHARRTAGPRPVGYLAAWSAAALYLWRFVDQGWIPHDDGMLAQVAERILAGELPHRDFDDPYTGGLGYVHAAGFLAFGVRILSLRIVLFLAALAWIPAVFAVARRFAPPAGAALVTAAALVWTVPNYFASLPSYYNLFFATWGTAALLRHLDTRAWRWLFLAGVCGGASFLVKSSGVYFVGAVVLYLLYRELLQHRGTERRSLVALGATTVAGLVFVAGLTGLVAARPGPTDIVQFLAPGSAVVALALWTDWSDGRGALPARLRGATRLLLPFLAGVLLPVALFLVPYAATGSVGAWYDGVFVTPMSRFDSAATDLPPPVTMLAALPYGLVLMAGAGGWRILEGRWGLVLLVTVVAIALGALAGGLVDSVYRFVWQSVRHLTLPVVVAACLLLARRGLHLPVPRRLELFLLAALAAFMPLVQIPFSATIYFCYAAPFLLLLGLAVVRTHPIRHQWVHPVLLAGYVLFAVLWTNTNYIWTLGAAHMRYDFVAPRILPRAGIEMTGAEAREYAAVVTGIHNVNRGKPYIYAGPDAPEVYFLSGTRNPTRTLYEFLRPAVDADETLDLLERKGIDVVVINRSPGFSGPLDRRLAEAFEQRYPYSVEVGRFLVRWRL